MNHIGIELRSEVHKKGYWHKSFQCWFVYKDSEGVYILFQKRHADKDTYPNLLDITAAGHLSAGETVEDASRELKEELGIEVDFKELNSLGVIREQKAEENFIDYEFGNVFLYYCITPIESFKLQLEEVTGIYKAELDEIIKLFNSEVNHISIEGYEVNSNAEKMSTTLEVEVKDFVPHALGYYNKIFEAAKKLRLP
jgi:isopentenyldiphosphate isomerase